MQFAGTGDYVEDSDGQSFLNGLSAVTVSLWKKSDASPTDRGMFTCEIPVGNDSKLTVRDDAAGASYGGTTLMKCAVTVVTDQQLETSNNSQDILWHHILFTWSSGNVIRFFIDGVEDTPTGADAAQTGSLTGLNTVRIGQGGKSGSPTFSYDGLIEDVRVYNRVLSDAEIETLAAARGVDRIVDGLVARWMLDEGALGDTVSGVDSVKNLSDNAMDMSPVASPTYAEGVLRSRRRTA